MIPVSYTKSIEPNIQKNNESIEILKNDKVSKNDIKKDEKIINNNETYLTLETDYNKITGDLVYKYMKQDMVLSQFPTEQIMKLREYLKEKGD